MLVHNNYYYSTCYFKLSIENFIIIIQALYNNIVIIILYEKIYAEPQ